MPLFTSHYQLITVSIDYISGKLVLRKGRLNIRNVATQSDIELSDL